MEPAANTISPTTMNLLGPALSDNLPQGMMSNAVT